MSKFEVNKTSGMEIIHEASAKATNIGNMLSSPNFKEIAIDNMIPSDKNFYDTAFIDDILPSIKEYGILQPCLVTERKDGSYEIIAGHRRHKAANAVGLLRIPCVIREEIDELDFRILLIHSNIQREKSPMEKAEEVKQLEEIIQQKRKNKTLIVEGESIEIVADIMEISKTTTKRLKNLTKLIPEIKLMVDDNKINPTTAEKFSTLSVDSQLEIYKSLLEKGSEINRDVAENLKKEYKKIEIEYKNKQMDLENKLKKIGEEKTDLHKRSQEKNEMIRNLTVSSENTASAEEQKKYKLENSELLSKISELEIEQTKLRNSLSNEHVDETDNEVLYQRIRLKTQIENIVTTLRTLNGDLQLLYNKKQEIDPTQTNDLFMEISKLIKVSNSIKE